MGASFRTKEQVIELAGCDLLTVSPQILEELSKSNVKVEKKLDAATTHDVPHVKCDEKSFRWTINEDEMAGFKLAEGIRKFAADLEKLEKEIKKKLEIK